MIKEPQALTEQLRVGKYGKFYGHRLSDNRLVEVEGLIVEIKEASWTLAKILTNNGESVVRIVDPSPSPRSCPAVSA